jgi:hypothetical protein
VPVLRIVAALTAVIVLAACGGPGAPRATTSDQVAAATRAMTVYRSPDCSCCHLWIDIARADGWQVATVNRLDMADFKAGVGVPAEFASCHTTQVGGYFVEGHVPLEAVEQLLAEKPDIDGIALPGMPAGSPGMGGLADGPFEVLAISDGVVTVFGSY